VNVDKTLISQLIAVGAAEFAGTMCSTFTALIHRMRGMINGKEDFNFAYDQIGNPVKFDHCKLVELTFS
jgi:hypothetical protein